MQTRLLTIAVTLSLVLTTGVAQAQPGEGDGEDQDAGEWDIEERVLEERVLEGLGDGARVGGDVGAAPAPVRTMSEAIAAAAREADESAQKIAANVPAESAMSDDPERKAAEESMFGDEVAELTEREQLEAEMFGGESGGDGGDGEGEQRDSGDDREALEDELFGGGSGDREDAIFGGREDPLEGSGSRGGSIFDEAMLEDPLAIGGQLFMRLNYSYRENDDLESSRLSSPNLLDLYLDARPNDRLRAYIRGRLRHDFTVQEGEVDPTTGQELEPTRVDLDQLWLKFDILRTVFVTLGRQPIRWGAGRFWNPTDFLNQQVRDPLAVLDERLGVSLLKLHIPFEGGLNLYVIANFEGASNPEDVGGALRFEWLFDLTEMAASFAARKGRPFRFGLDMSTGVWLFDLKLEGALRYKDQSPYYEGELDLASATVPTEVDRSDEVLPEIVAGFEIGVNYTEEDAVYVGAEYYYNHAGYEDSAIIPWLLFNGAFRPLYTGKHYAGLYAFLPAPGSWNDTNLILSTLSNLNDPSFVTRLDYRVRVLTYLDLNVFVNGYYGNRGEFRLGIDIPPAPIEGLEEGFTLEPPVFDVGLGALLRI